MSGGLFVAMPSRKTADGAYRDVAHPITADAREVISETVLKAYGDMTPGR
jgi:stage V sporulation protein G